jgi:hypothetical protein
MTIDYRNKLIEICQQRQRVADAVEEFEAAREAAKMAKDQVKLEEKTLFAMLSEDPDQEDLFGVEE